jgi:hypothetical protein
MSFGLSFFNFEIGSNVIHELPYDQSSPDQAIAEAVQWAEGKLQELQRKFESTYPWRARS